MSQFEQNSTRTKQEKVNVLIQTLADGKLHSGEALGEVLGISRAGVWKYIKLLEQLGLPVEAIRGQGYRIVDGLNLLNRQQIVQELNASTRALFHSIHLFGEIDSTNEYLLGLAEQQENHHGSVCIAEKQTAGRGRRGRNWVSPYARNIYCSLLWRFDAPMSALEGLSLVVAMAIHEALVDLGVKKAQLKWPNDLLVEGKKLSGILIEVRGDLVDYCNVVIGFGINVDMPEASQKAIDQAWTDLKMLLGEAPNRNRVLGLVLQSIANHLQTFEQSGFAGFQKRWNELDIFINQPVEVHAGQSRQAGIARGVNVRGALLLEHDGVIREIHGGEVSLRGAHATLV